MKASIIITTFRRPEILKTRSLKSALSQRFNDYEVIVVDDCSEDETEKIVKEAGAQYIKQDINKGVSAARNVGIQHAKGDYVVCLDDDDALDPEFLMVTVPLLDSKKEIDGISVGRNVIYPEGIIYQKAHNGTFYCSIDDGFLIRREIFNDIQYDEFLLTDEDADFGLQFLKKYRLLSVNRPLLLKYGHKVINKISFSQPSKRRLEGLNRFLKKNLEEFEKDPNEYAYICQLAGRNYILGGQREKGLWFLRESYRVKPHIRKFFHIIFASLGKQIYFLYYVFETKMHRFNRIYLRRV